jgi:hypothetical protein
MEATLARGAGDRVFGDTRPNLPGVVRILDH